MASSYGGALSRDQKPGAPACSVITIVTGTFLMSKGSDPSVLGDASFVGAMQSGEAQYRKLCAPGGAIEAERNNQLSKSRFLHPNEVLKTLRSSDGTFAFEHVASYTGLHYTGELPANIASMYKEMSKGGAVVDGDKSVPMKFATLQDAVFDIENMSAELKKPVAAAIVYCGHTTGFVAMYVGPNESIYYLHDSLPGRWYATRSYDAMERQLERWLPPYSYTGSAHQRAEDEHVPASMYTLDAYVLATRRPSAAAAAPATRAPPLPPTAKRSAQAPSLMDMDDDNSK